MHLNAVQRYKIKYYSGLFIITCSIKQYNWQMVKLQSCMEFLSLNMNLVNMYVMMQYFRNNVSPLHTSMA